MTLFEYLAIAYSLVISLAAVRAASVLPYILDRNRRYWVHTVWVLLNLAGCLLLFWNFWSYRDIEWTLGRFAAALALPTSLFVVIAIVAPDEPAQIQSWRDYYYSVRVKLFVASIAFTVVGIVLSVVVIKFPVFHPVRLGQIGFLAVCVTGALSNRPGVHASLPLLTILSLAVFVILLANQPGALTGIAR